MKSTIALTCVVMLWSVNLMAQGSIKNKTITWFSDRSVELHSNQDLSLATKIITNTNKTIDLIRTDGSLSFDVTKVQGDWSDPSVDGTLTYNVKYQGKAGVITFKKMSEEFSCTIDFTDVFPEAMKQKILITRFE